MCNLRHSAADYHEFESFNLYQIKYLESNDQYYCYNEPLLIDLIF